MEVLPLGAHSAQFTSLSLSLFKAIGIDGEEAKVLLSTLSTVIKSKGASVNDQRGSLIPSCSHELEKMGRVISEMLSLQKDIEKIALCQRICRRHLTFKWAHAVSTK